MFDVGNPRSFDNVPGWHQELLVATHTEPGVLPCVLVANKIDCERLVERDAALRWCEQHLVTLFECSAKESINVEQTFRTLAQGHITRRSNESKQSKANVANAGKKKKRKKL
jgi:GTPase SAR1 family protein